MNFIEALNTSKTDKLRRKAWPKNNWIEIGENGGEFQYIQPNPFCVGQFKYRPYVFTEEIEQEDWEDYQLGGDISNAKNKKKKIKYLLAKHDDEHFRVVKKFPDKEEV